MRIVLPICLLLTSALYAGERITVAICNFAGITKLRVQRAQATAQSVFGPLGVDLDWVRCDDGPAAGEPTPNPRFIIRLRKQGPEPDSKALSLHTLGRAFVLPDVPGVYADAYCDEIRHFAAAQHSASDDEQVLGYTIVHELGHLLLGPGHARQGIMREAWGPQELGELRRHSLRFERRQEQAIHRALAARAAPDSSDPVAALP